jgi:hypothetical protein
MADVRGRPLGYLALGIATWVAGRIYVNDTDRQNAPFAPTGITYTTTSQHPIAPSALAAKSAQAAATPILPRSAERFSQLSGFTPALDPWQDGGRPSGLSTPRWVAETDKPLSTGRDTPPTNAYVQSRRAGQPNIKRRWGREIYAYSFWRTSNAANPALAPSAQYGTSQSGLVGTIDPFGHPNRGVALLIRGSITPDGKQREAALGLRWRPSRRWPVSLSVERRLQSRSPDQFAAYLAGGVDSVDLPGKLIFNAFGQAGYATGGGGFFDAQARILHPVTKAAPTRLSIGIGGWAGGQRGLTRLDVGPTIGAHVDTRFAKFDIRLDWRLRAAGNAAPKNGLALTVSTGF